jgi:hypothetical protein
MLLISTAPIYAQDSPSSATPASKCDGLKAACSAAAAELKAARALIRGYEEHIAAADERIEIALKEILTLRQMGALQTQHAQELEKVIAAERDAKAILLKVKAEQEKRLVNLEKRLSRSRKFALIAGVAAGVAILLGASR